MINFFVLLALIFGSVYFYVSQEEIPEVVEEEVSSKKEVKTVVEMANYLSEKEKEKEKVVVQASVEVEKENPDLSFENDPEFELDERALAAIHDGQVILNDPENTVPQDNPTE
jgi:hypothetical protein